MTSSKLGKVFVSLGALLSVILIATLAPLGVSADDGGGYGENCTSDDNCTGSLGLACNKGECDCARPKEMTWNNETSSCIVLESFSCEKTPALNASEFACTSRATCVTTPGPNNSTAETKHCKCQEGYSATHENQCRASFGTICDEDKETCNAFALLVCSIPKGETVGKCSCYDPTEDIYEPSLQKCVALAGGKCAIGQHPYILNCTEHATCHLEENAATKNTTGTCICDKGFKIEKISGLTTGRCVNGVPTLFASIYLVLFAILISHFSSSS